MRIRRIGLRTRHAHERVIIEALRLMAAPLPAPTFGEEMLRRAGMTGLGVSALAAVVTMLPYTLPRVRIYDVGSPFV